MDKDNKQSPYEAGKAAFEAGKAIADCDRPQWTVSYDEWVEGFHAAQWDAEHAEARAKIKSRTETNLGTAAFVFEKELEAWKLVKFSFDNVVAVRSCGRMVKHGSEEGARDAIKREAARAILEFYHETATLPAIARATGASV